MGSGVLDSRNIHLGTGEDPSRFACSKLTGAPFYDRGRSKSGDGPGDGPPRAARGGAEAVGGKNSPFKAKEGKVTENEISEVHHSSRLPPRVPAPLRDLSLTCDALLARVDTRGNP